MSSIRRFWQTSVRPRGTAAYQITRRLADAGINLRGVSAGLMGRKFLLFLALDHAADADKAACSLRAAAGKESEGIHWNASGRSRRTTLENAHKHGTAETTNPCAKSARASWRQWRESGRRHSTFPFGAGEVVANVDP
jgi:hypothetical protein